MLLKQTIVKRHFGEDDAERKDMFLTRPHGLEPTNEDVDQALLHVNRANTIWLEIKTRQNIRIETVQSKIPPIPLLREITLSPPDTTITSTVTLALKMKIRHEGEFTYPTVDELLHNLDYALNQQAGSSCLSPESLDAVTNHFTFSVLEVSKDS